MYLVPLLQVTPKSAENIYAHINAAKRRVSARELGSGLYSNCATAEVCTDTGAMDAVGGRSFCDSLTSAACGPRALIVATMVKTGIGGPMQEIALDRNRTDF